MFKENKTGEIEVGQEKRGPSFQFIIDKIKESGEKMKDRIGKKVLGSFVLSVALFQGCSEKTDDVALTPEQSRIILLEQKVREQEKLVKEQIESNEKRSEEMRELTRSLQEAVFLLSVKRFANEEEIKEEVGVEEEEDIEENIKESAVEEEEEDAEESISSEEAEEVAEEESEENIEGGGEEEKSKEESEDKEKTKDDDLFSYDTDDSSSLEKEDISSFFSENGISSNMIVNVGGNNFVIDLGERPYCYKIRNEELKKIEEIREEYNKRIKLVEEKLRFGKVAALKNLKKERENMILGVIKEGEKLETDDLFDDSLVFKERLEERKKREQERIERLKSLRDLKEKAGL